MPTELLVRRARGAVLPIAASLLAALAVLPGCGSSSSSGSPTQAVSDELRASGFGDYLDVQTPHRQVQDGLWTHHYFDPAAEQAICLNGSEFQVSVREGASDDVLLYLQGGGACWDYLTCHVIKTALTTANDPGESGIIALGQPGNPFRDFDVVYVPYCDGSVFTGDATVDYEGIRTFHHGLWNLTVAVDAVKRQFPDARRIVLAGSSAGGYGTFSGYGVLRAAFPDTEIVVFNDSGPGLQNPDAEEDVLNRVRNWDFTKRIPESCTECDPQFSFLLDWALVRDPAMRVALYSYQQDGTISGFLDMSGPAYQSLLLDVSGELHRRHPERFQRFFPLGTQHTILQYGEFYTQTIHGVAIRDWTQAFLDEDPSWADVIE
jgi:hypothetical protein